MAAKPSLFPLHYSLLLIIIITLYTTSSSSPLTPLSSNLFLSKQRPRFPSKFSDQIKTQQQYQYEIRYFRQELDHFSFSNLPKFPQRYLINTEHWAGPKQLGPVFLYTGGESNIERVAAHSGFIWEIAPRFGAAVVFAEHRYYGKSIPFGSKEEASNNASTLSYLTAAQALADLALLITDLKINLSAEACPVVLFGGSYGGMLAAWMRLKYPHIAIGALASSAPVLQFGDIVPPETFYNILSYAFKRESSSCFKTIKESWSVLKSEGLKEGGLKRLAKTFRLCGELQSTVDIANWLDMAYSVLGMSNYPYPSDFVMPLPGHPIREVCRKIDGSPDSNPLERVFNGVSIYYNYTGDASCFELDDGPQGKDGWDWQQCTEMVAPISSDPDKSMYPGFDFNYSSYQEDCWKRFQVIPWPKWITTEFGGHDIEHTLKHFGSNIIFSNGLLDPISGGSVLTNISQTIVALVTAEGSHHLDLRAATPEDPDWLVKQRAAEIKLIEGWLNGYRSSRKETIQQNTR